MSIEVDANYDFNKGNLSSVVWCNSWLKTLQPFSFLISEMAFQLMKNSFYQNLLQNATFDMGL